MPKIEEIEQALERASNFLVGKQDKDGSWKSIHGKYNEPQHLGKNIIITSEVVSALAKISNPKNIDSIIKGLNFCLNYKQDPKDNLDVYSTRLSALKYSNTALSDKICRRLASHILAAQTKNGPWKSFPHTSNLTNFISIYSLKKSGFEKNQIKLIQWFKRNKAKDGLGWGLNNESHVSEPSFTANVILASIFAGASPTSEYLQSAKKFLESKQLSDGGFYSSSMTVESKSTTYSTALCTLSLILLSEDVFNVRIEKGIKFLLKSQDKRGFWPLVERDKTFIAYTDFYVIETLSFYLFLEKILKTKHSDFKNLKNLQHITVFLYDIFEKEINKNLFLNASSNIIKSKLIGVTQESIQRRMDILKILGDLGEMEIAEVIDELKKAEKYSFLNKRSHFTQIKSDLDYLQGLNLITNNKNRYSLVFELI